MNAAAEAPSSASPPPAKQPVVLELRELELQKLHRLDVANQSFAATLWIEFVIAGGKGDPHLSAKGKVFPVDPQTGAPTFTPSAEWYLSQLDCRNALHFSVLDAKVFARGGEDLHCTVRVEGEFTECFELVDYPFDVQGLTMSINFNCRANGPLPMEIRVAPTCTVTMTCIHLCPPNKEWRVYPELHVRAHLVGVGERTFPGLSCTAKAQRDPFYHVVYLGVPWGLLSLLAVLTSNARRPSEGSHRAQLSLMLVLLAFTYRIAAAAKLPPINYFTLLDSYTLPNALLMMLIALENRVVTFFVDPAPAEPTRAHRLAQSGDLLFVCAISIGWLAFHIHYARVACALSHRPRLHDANLQDPASRVLSDRATTPAAPVRKPRIGATGKQGRAAPGGESQAGGAQPRLLLL